MSFEVGDDGSVSVFGVNLGNASDIIGGSLGLLGTNLAVNQGKADLGQIRKDITSGSGFTNVTDEFGNPMSLQQQIAGQAEFKPYSVTSGVQGMGQSSYDPTTGALTIGDVALTSALQSSAGSDLSTLGSGLPSSLFSAPVYGMEQRVTGGYKPSPMATTASPQGGFISPVTGGYTTGQGLSGSLGGGVAGDLQGSIADGTYQYGAIGKAFESGQITPEQRDALSQMYYASPVSRTPMNQQARVDLHRGLGNERTFLAPLQQQQQLGTGSLADIAMRESAQAMQSNAGQSATQQGLGLMGMGTTFLNQQAPSSLGNLETAFTTQALQLPTTASQGLLGLGETSTALAQEQLGQGVTDVTGTFQGIDSPDVRTGSGQFSQGLLAQAQQGLQQDTPTAQSIFDQIRAMQTPEEERQRMALENRLAAQGRLGVQTSAFGGTPEQLALEKAQAEARNQASLQAIGMADQLASSQQARATQLGQLGLSGEQIQAQLDAEGFGRDMSLAGADLQAQQAQEALQSSAQNRAAQLAQLGLSTEQIASQLQSEGLARTTQSAATAAQMAQTGAGIRAQQQQIGQGLLGLGLQAQGLGGTLGSQDIANAATLFGLGQQATLTPAQLEAAQLANITAQLQASNIPYSQQMQALQQAQQTAQLAQAGQLAQLSATAQLGGAELNMLKELGLGESALDAELVKAIGNIFSGAEG